jgi:hypothetical protein
VAWFGVWFGAWLVALPTAPAGSTEFKANAPTPRAVMMLMVAMSFFMLHTLAGDC